MRESSKRNNSINFNLICLIVVVTVTFIQEFSPPSWIMFWGLTINFVVYFYVTIITVCIGIDIKESVTECWSNRWVAIDSIFLFDNVEFGSQWLYWEYESLWVWFILTRFVPRSSSVAAKYFILCSLNNSYSSPLVIYFRMNIISSPTVGRSLID